MKKLYTLISMILILQMVSCKADLTNVNDPFSSSYKKETNAFLKGLALSKGSLTPSFDKFTYEYTAGVSNLTASITVTPETETEYSSVTVNGTAVESGSASSEIALNIANNSITVDVTAEDGVTVKPYKITVYRAIALPKTGLTACYDSLSNPIGCAGTGQDGDLQKGSAWPEPRFTDNTNGTITDNLTGLMWTANANLMPVQYPGWDKDYTPAEDDGMVLWNHTFDYVGKLNTDSYAAHADWRLPNVYEQRSLVNYGEADLNTWLAGKGFTTFTSPSPIVYWTSTTCLSGGGWYIQTNAATFNIGDIKGDQKNNARYAWALRSGENASVPLPKTGQTKCYDPTGDTDVESACSGTGQDGEVQAGIEWPDPRLINNNDGTVTDRLSGLMWQSASIANKTWQEALDYANGSTEAGYTDWRLPNVNELTSLVNLGTGSNVTWLNQSGFKNFQAGDYWTSTTYSANPSTAYTVTFDWSTLTAGASKSNAVRILIVRDAE